VGSPQAFFVHQSIAEHARRRPTAPALYLGDSVIDYGTLNRRADSIAALLRCRRILPDTLVGVSTVRPDHFVTAILGVLKAGAAYVPLEPTYPEERLAWMASDAAITALLADAGTASSLSVDLVRIDSLANRADVAGGTRLDPLNLAYVMYTSGSTGKPKGVAIQHCSVSNLVTCYTRLFEIGPRDCILQFAPHSFDVSVLEIFCALCAGASLCLLDAEARLSPNDIAAEMRAKRVTIIDVVPSLLDLLPADDFPDLRLVLTGMEPFSRKLINDWLIGSRRFINGYGPTEATVVSTVMECTRDTEGAPPIGFPIANTTAYIVDEDLRRVEPGEAGELCIGGIGVARGYLGQPALTADKFIPDPFSAVPGARMYRTGDIARQADEDAPLEFLGRKDHQVKVRGFRVELGEIETTLREHPHVREAVVVLTEAESLAAYVTAFDHDQPNPRLLLDYLAERLPPHMVPSTLTAVDSLPRTESGKVDRRALPTITRPPAATLERGSPLEETVVGVCREVLGVGAGLGLDDDLFAFGLHSLAAMRIIGRLERDLSAPLAVQQILHARSARGFASLIKDRRERAPRAALDERLDARSDAAIAGSPPEAAIGHCRWTPLSLSQQIPWFFQELVPNNRAYTFSALVRLEGSLDEHALEAALNAVVVRHEILRTTFRLVDGVPMQRVEPEATAALRREDISALPEEARERRLDELVHEEVRRSFDPSRLPLIRWTLVRVTESRHVLVHCEHHLVHDGWSFTVLLRDILEMYSAAVEERPPRLPQLDWQFRHYVAWEQQRLEAHGEQSLDYWVKQLQGAPRLELPTDRRRVGPPRLEGESFRSVLSTELSARLKAFSRENGITLFSAMLTAFFVLIGRYVRSDDVVVGTAVANRGRPELDDLVGMLVNTLALRLDLADDPSLREAALRAAGVVEQALPHQDLPIHRVVHALGGGRDLSRHPIFQTMFAFHDSPLPRLPVPNLQVSVYEGISNGSAKFDLQLVVIPDGDRSVTGPHESADSMILTWEYATDLFDRQTVERVAGHYERILRELVANPHGRLSKAVMLSTPERHVALGSQLVPAVEGAGETILGKLAEHAVRTPTARAIVQGDRAMTFRELESLSSAIAAKLAANRIRAGSIVGVFLNRSPELVACILGVLKAGAAYLPIDPSYPEERIHLMLSDAHVAAVLTATNLEPRVRLGSTRVILIDDPAAGCPPRPWRRASVPTDAPAYVIYTSGSTGRPKPAVVHRGGLENLVRWYVGEFEIANDDRVALVTSISFDLTQKNIFAVIVAGCELHLPQSDTYDPAEIVSMIDAAEVTLINCANSTFYTILDEAVLSDSTLRSLRSAVIGAEPMSPRRILKAAPQLAQRGVIVNTYGPTECADVCGLFRIERLSDFAERPVPIGRAITNAHMAILDSNLRPMLIGGVGEIYVGGAGVGLGYLNHPAATAERFVPNPFPEWTGSRIYGTGDLGKQLPTGELVFIGRIDQQLKVRGFRVEPGEIEAVLLTHPTVRDAAVVLDDSNPEIEARLAGYVVTERPIHQGDLDAFLKRQLPAHMVPSLLYALDALPRTPSGKLDRMSLSSAVPLAKTGPFRKPQTDYERALAEAWSEVLGLDEISADADFFQLGGHSLAATRVAAALRAKMGLTLPLRLLFDEPVLCDLASALEKEIRAKESRDYRNNARGYQTSA
jgi:amino acid adenylation domain-containing protein